MRKFIENLQNKSEPTKRVIMWTGIIFVMTIIFTFWFLTFPSQIPKTEDNEAAANLKKELPSVFETLKTQINDLKNLWPK